MRKVGGKASDEVDLGAFNAPNTYLVEGRIAAMGRLARGTRDAGPEQWRFIGVLAAASLAVLIAVGFALWLLDIT